MLLMTLQRQYQRLLKSLFAYFSNRTCNSIFLAPATTIEVNAIINSLNPSKPVDPSSIPMKLLKSIGYSVSRTFCSSCESVLPVWYFI